MAKEFTFLNNTIQMVSLIAHRLDEEACDADANVVPNATSAYWLHARFCNLCALVETDITTVNAMTRADRPITDNSIRTRCNAENTVVACIRVAFETDNCHHATAQAFQELRDTSDTAWQIMASLASSNVLARLSKGTEFEVELEATPPSRRTRVSGPAETLKMYLHCDQV